MRIKSTAVSIHVFLLFMNVADANEVDRLLPSSVESQVEVLSRLDGRAVYAKVINKSQYVITGFTLSCSARSRSEISYQKTCDEKRAAGNAARRSQGWIDGPYADLIVEPEVKNNSNDGCRYYRAPESVLNQTLQKKVASGAEIDIYAEIPAGMGGLYCNLYDLRGRQKRWYE